MTDYSTLDISYLDRNHLIKLLPFSAPAKVDAETGDVEVIKQREGSVKPELTAKYKNLLFEIYRNGFICVKGSLHVYFNNGEHNYNDFTIDNFIWVLNDLQQRFGIIPAKTSIRHLEFGLNIDELIHPSPRIIQNLMFQGGKGKEPLIFKYEKQKTKSEFKTTERDEYTLKVYDKSLHYGLKSNILRFECKAHVGSSLKSIGIHYLSDLLNPDIRVKLGQRLISLWDEVVLNDWTIRTDELSSKDQIKLKDWKNANYWIDLHKETRAKNRNKFSKELAEYRKIVQDHSDNVHQVIKETLIEKWCKIVTVTQTTQISQKVQDHSNILNDLAPIPEPKKLEFKRRLCMVTRLDISNQKKGSVYLREFTIKSIYENNSKLYQILLESFGPTYKQINAKMDVYVAIAKNIRNVVSNRSAKARKQLQKFNDAFERYKNTLFPFGDEPRLSSEI